MPIKPKSNPVWFIITLFPTFMATLGLCLFYIAMVQAWGGDTQLSRFIGIFFAEINLVFCAAALLANFKVLDRGGLSLLILRFNVVLLLSSFSFGIYLFLK